MIGTRSPLRSFVVFVTIALAATVLALVWGCNEWPVSAPGVNAPAPNAIPLTRDEGHKPDLAETTGTIDEIDTATLRLRVGALWFHADGETEVEADACGTGCSFSDLGAGDAVKIKHDRVAGAGGSYYAREIEVENEDDGSDDLDDQAETAGVVEAVDTGAFQVAGVWFWTDAATVFEIEDACIVSALAVGDPVKVEHAATETVGFGFYAFKVEIKRGCEEPDDDDDGVVIENQ